jgi:hypothetical protein
VDVWPNQGDHTLLIAACGPHRHAVACEPNPPLAESNLPGNVALHGVREQVEGLPASHRLVRHMRG